MREHNKRWLVSMMKSSGSRRDHLVNGRYADERHLQDQHEPEELPSHERIKSTQKVYNGKINYGLLVRFLRGQVGHDWDEVYSEIVSRIPTKLLEFKDQMIYGFVADKVDIIDGRPWNKKTQRFIRTDEPYETVYYTEVKYQPENTAFYVDPVTNKLVHIQREAYKKVRPGRSTNQ